MTNWTQITQNAIKDAEQTIKFFEYLEERRMVRIAFDELINAIEYPEDDYLKPNEEMWGNLRKKDGEE
jgi:hypothetical protein